jgi:hypothetical protein
MSVDLWADLEFCIGLASLWFSALLSNGLSIAVTAAVVPAFNISRRVRFVINSPFHAEKFLSHEQGLCFWHVSQHVTMIRVRSQA